MKGIVSVTITISMLIGALWLSFLAIILAHAFGEPDPAACFNAPKSEVVESAVYFLNDRYGGGRSVRLGEFSNTGIRSDHDPYVEIEVIDRSDNQLMGYVVRYNNCDLEWRDPVG